MGLSQSFTCLRCRVGRDGVVCMCGWKGLAGVRGLSVRRDDGDGGMDG